MNNNTLVGVVVIAIGVLAFVGAVLDWRIVNHSGKLLNRLLGDAIARAVYAAIGVALVAIGVGRLTRMLSI